MIRDIILWPNPILAQVCNKVDFIDNDVRELAQDMLDTMYSAPGRGLAAPQIGINRRLFVMDASWKDGQPQPRVLINPEIQTSSEIMVTGPEGCLSIPGILADVTRHSEITMRWTNLSGETEEERLVDFEAICAQHELDHLNGIVTFDRVAPEIRTALESEYTA